MNKRMSFGLLLSFVLLSFLLGTGSSVNAAINAQEITPPDKAPAATVGTAITYQGQLTKNSAAVTGSCDMQFKLWDTLTAGTQQGSTLTRTSVGVSQGVFTVNNLDFGSTPFDGDALYIEVAVKCSGDASYVTLSPRQALTAAPYALSLRPGALVYGPTHGLGIHAIAMGTGLRGEGNAYGVLGTTNNITGYSVGVRGESASTGGWGVHGVSTAISGTVYGVGGVVQSPDGYGVYGKNDATTGDAYGVYGESVSPFGYGVYGYHHASAGLGYGVYGQTNSTYGRAVVGTASAVSGTTIGVLGTAVSPDGWALYGNHSATSGDGGAVYGKCYSPDGYAVYAQNFAGTGDAYGLYAESNSTSGRAVVGMSTVVTGSTIGVYGHSSSPDGRAVYGGNSATTGDAYGLRGVTYSTAGKAVSGEATANTGVTYGVHGSVDSSAGTGVYGQANNAACDTGIPGDICQGVAGKSAEGYGVRGETTNGVALGGYMSGSGTGLSLTSAGSGYFIAAGNFFPADTKFSVSSAGNVRADGTFASPAADMAELLPAQSGLEPGDVLVIGLDGKLTRCTQANQPTVVGVYSTKPAFLGGDPNDNGTTTGKVPLAVIGVVPVKVSAENGAIRPGDLLVSSATPGHAMRAGANPAVGTIIGKALTGLDKGTGVITMLVLLQ